MITPWSNMPRIHHRLSLRVVTLTMVLAAMTAIVGISGIFSLQEFKEDYQKVKDNQFETLLNITEFKGQSYEILKTANGMFLADNKNDLQWDVLYISDKQLWLDKLFKQLYEATDNYQELSALKLRLFQQTSVTSKAMLQLYQIANRFFIQYEKVEQYKYLQMSQRNYDVVITTENIMTLFNPMKNKNLTLEKEVKLDDVSKIINSAQGKISNQEYTDLNTLFMGESSLFAIYKLYISQLERIKALRAENKQLSYLIASVTGKTVLSIQKKFLINLHKIEEKIATRKSRLYILLIICFSIAFVLAVLQINFLKRVHLIRKVIDAGYSKTQDQIPIKGKDEFSEMARAVKDYIDQLLSKEQEVSETNKKLKHLATHDGLTNIYNRRYFDTHFSQEHLRYLRYKEPYCLAMFDLDFFKNINDMYGHDIGDKVLIEFTSRVSEKMRQTDVFARFGGEEFALLMPRTNENNALKLMQRIIEVTNSTPCIVGQLKIDFTTSIGLVEVQKIEDMQDASKQLIFADKALYQAKQTGRNKVCVYQGES
tara:strand:+ start:2741 stop:4360 length:1620 start_codon:yes stop_codon:yes gene_type:complete